MWHEARKHSKKLRGLMIDHKKRAERRKSYYEKIRKDTAEFLQICGRQCKIHIDANVTLAGDNPSIMTTWRDTDTIIDRFDARFHLDLIDVNLKESLKDDDEGEKDEQENEYDYSHENELHAFKDLNELKACNYERYRKLVFNEADEIGEENFFKQQIEIEEKYGYTHENANKKPKEPKAQISYTYEDSHVIKTAKIQSESSESDSTNDNSDLDGVKDVSKLDFTHKKSLNRIACSYGMSDGDFVRFLQQEKREKETLREQKLLDEQKAHILGRQSRNERRKAKENVHKFRPMSPLSYAIPEINDKQSDSDDCDGYDKKSSKSSPSPRHKPKIEFISSFGADNDEKDNHMCAIDNEILQINLPNLVNNAKKSLNLIRREISLSPTNDFEKNSLNNHKKVLKPDTSSDSSSDYKANIEMKEYLKRKENRQMKTTTDLVQNINSHSSILKTSNPCIKQDDYCNKTQREKLKKRMQKQLSTQYRKDKELEVERRNREYEERRIREAQWSSNSRNQRSSSSSSTESSSSSSSSESSRRTSSRTRSRNRRRCSRSSSTSSRSRSRSRRRRSRSSPRYRRRQRSSSRSSSRKRGKYYKRERSRSRSRK